MSEKEMTAAEILRKAAEGGFEGSTGETYRNISVLMGAGRNVLNSETCRALADQIEDEIGEARDESLRQSAELWAKANGWPEFKEGEDFGQWLDRCSLRLPLVDGEPLAKDMVLKGCEKPVGGWCVYEDGSGTVYDKYSNEIAEIREYSCSDRDNRLHLAKTEALDARTMGGR